MKVGFIDKYLDEWHANNLPKWLNDETDELEKYVNKNHSAVLVLYDITVGGEENKKPSTDVVKILLDKVTKFPPEVVKSLVTIEFREKHDEIKKQAEDIAKSYNVPFYFIHEKSPEFYRLKDDIYIQTVNSILENIKKQPGRNIKEQTAELEEKKKEEEMKEQKDKLEGKEEDLSNTEKVTVFLLGKGEEDLDYAKYWIIKFAFSDTPELVLKKAGNGLEARFNYLSKKILLKIVYSKGYDIEKIRQAENPTLDFGVCFVYNISTKLEFPRSPESDFKIYLNLIKEKNEFFSHAVKVLLGVRLSESVNLSHEFSNEISETIKATNIRLDFRNEKCVGFLTKCFIDIARKIVNNRKSKGPLLKANLAKKTGKKEEIKNKETEKKNEVKEKEEAKVTKINSEGKKGEEDIIKAQTSKSEKEKKQEKEKEKNGDNINGKINEEKKQEKEKENIGDNINGGNK